MTAGIPISALPPAPPLTGAAVFPVTQAGVTYKGALSGLLSFVTATASTWSAAQNFSAGLTGNLTGNVTGNVTGAVTGNATTATHLATARTISISGDLSYASPAFDGSGNVTAAGTLATVNASPGSYGDSVTVPTLVVNAKGLVTASSATPIPAASTSVSGLAPLATGAQVATGTDTTHAVTPAALAAAMSLTSNGYLRLQGGLIIQWGSVAAAGVTTAIVFPLAFPTSVWNILLTAGSVPGAPAGHDSVSGVGLSGFTLQNASGGASNFYWFALGK